MVQQTLADGERVVEEFRDGSRLIERDDGGGGAFIERFPEPLAGYPDGRTDYDRYRNARLHAGLWVRVGGFSRPKKDPMDLIPINVVAGGREAVAAWLFLGGCNGHPVGRDQVTERLDVSEETVSVYLSRVRAEIPARPEDRIIDGSGISGNSGQEVDQ